MKASTTIICNFLSAIAGGVSAAVAGYILAVKPAQEQHDEKIRQAEQSLEKLEKFNEELHGRITGIDGEKERFNTELTENRETLNDLKNQINQSLEELGEAQKTHAQFEKNLREAKSRQNSWEKEIDELKKKSAALAAHVGAKAELAAVEIEAEAAADRDRAKKMRIKVKLASAETKALLAPFYTPSLSRPKRSNINYGDDKPRAYHVRTDQTRATPMSYNIIVKSRGLENSDLGVKQLLVLARLSNDKRPDWVIPQTEEGWERIRQAQTLLRDHGLQMVEFGLLSP